MCPVTFSWQPRFTEQWKAKHFVSILCQEAAVGPTGRYCRLSRFTPVIYLINEKLQVWGPNRRASKPRTCTKELLKWAGECAHEVRQRGTLKYSRQGRSNQGGADSHSQEREKKCYQVQDYKLKNVFSDKFSDHFYCSFNATRYRNCVSGDVNLMKGNYKLMIWVCQQHVQKHSGHHTNTVDEADVNLPPGFDAPHCWEMRSFACQRRVLIGW